MGQRRSLRRDMRLSGLGHLHKGRPERGRRIREQCLPDVGGLGGRCVWRGSELLGKRDRCGFGLGRGCLTVTGFSTEISGFITG